MTTDNTTDTRPPKELTKGTAVKIELIPGLSFWKGTVAEAYLPEFKSWQKAYKIYKQMQDDAVIGTLYESVTVPLLDSKFHIEAISDSDADKRAAEWLALQTIDNPNIDWHSHVEEMLDFLAFGWSLSEKVLEKDKKEGGLALIDLMPIGQDTLYRWGDLDKHGRVTSFIQYDTTTIANSYQPNYNGVNTGSQAIRKAPMSKLLHFVFRQRKRSPIGTPISRSVYRSWYFKSNFEVIEGIGAERDVGNVPIAQLGEGFYTDEDIAKIRSALEKIRLDETSSMIIPHGTEVKPFGSGGKVYDLRGMIRDYAHLIRQRFFMDFVSLGSEQVGTQALAKEVTGFFSLALGSVQKQMLEVWQKQLVNYLFEWNKSKFPEITEYPKLRWAKPGKLNVQGLAGSVATLLGSQIIHYTPELEHHMRELFELPPITDAEIQTEIKKQEELQNPQPNVDAEAQTTDKNNPEAVPSSKSGPSPTQKETTATNEKL